MHPDASHSSHSRPAAADDEPLFDEQPSKSRRKRDMAALQDLGEALVELGPERLKKISLPESLRDAVRACQGFRMEARRRQLQYIGKLMRGVEVEPIRAQLDALRGVSAAAVAQAHALEDLRSRLLADEQVLGEIITRWPMADLQHLRSLRRNALREQAADKPPRAFREIYQQLRGLQQAEAAGAAAADAGDAGDES